MNRKAIAAILAVAATGSLIFYFNRKKKNNTSKTKNLSITNSEDNSGILNPEAFSISDLQLSAPDGASDFSAVIPCAVIKFIYDENAQNVDEEFYEVNFTPRTAASDPSSVSGSVLENVNNPTGDRLNNMIHPSDLQQVIQLCDLTPTNNLDFVRSPNGRNLFVVGYSEEKNIKTSVKIPNTQTYITTPAHNILWAISFGVPFDKRPYLAQNLAALNDNTFLDVAQRLLVAETGKALNRGASTKFVSDVQKAALLSMLLYRKKRKIERGRVTGPITFESVISGPNNSALWSEAPSFICLYKGYPPKFVLTTEAAKALPIKEVPVESIEPFNTLMRDIFWQMPNFAEDGPSSFVHYKELDTVPSWIGNTESATKNANAYFRHRNVIRIGDALIVDRAGELS